MADDAIQKILYQSLSSNKDDLFISNPEFEKNGDFFFFYQVRYECKVELKNLLKNFTSLYLDQHRGVFLADYKDKGSG